MDGKQLETYLEHGVERVLKGIWRASAPNPKSRSYLLRYAGASRRAAARRARAERRGEHVPPFLIASITDRCNLCCMGCYARANHTCGDLDGVGEGLLTGEQWGDIFRQAAELGVGFILLAGGEPFLREDVLRAAAERPDILFPVFTNGTMLNGERLALLAAAPNLIPILSLEGDKAATDARRGAGVYDALETSMAALKAGAVLFGASVTVTRENAEEVLSDAFVDGLWASGGRAVVYVEYVPVDGTSQSLAPDDGTRAYLQARLDELRSRAEGPLLVAFPGDELHSGGCLAAGRGFFHINARGGAEPCPFSPYSDTSVIHTSLGEALRSPLFQKLRAEGHLEKGHAGGCVLFAQADRVRELAEEGRA